MENFPSKIYSSIVALSLLIPKLSLAASGVVLSGCSINGQPVPCSQIWSSFRVVIIPIVIILALASLFWIWMLIDAIRRPMNNKPMWILLILFTHLLGAITYYFSVKRNNQS
jgi:hypothetical protein